MEFYTEKEYLSLLEKNKKIKLFLIFFNVIILILMILFYLLTTRENQLLMKILMCTILILSLYVDCYLIFETYNTNNKYIKHFMTINKYDEVVINDFKLLNYGEKFTKDGILFIVIELEHKNKKGIYYIKEESFNLIDINNLLAIYSRGHFIAKVKGGVL